MSQFESNIKTIPFTQELVYNKLSDLNNLEKVKDRIPADKVQDLSFDADTLSFNVSPVGTVTLKVIEREAPKTIKFGTDQSPIPFNMWIQIVPADDNSSKIKLTIKADINPMMKAMINKPIQDGLEKMAEMLSAIDYSD